MKSPAPGDPSRETGLPPGVEVAPLGKRFVAYLIDFSVPAVVRTVIGSCCRPHPAAGSWPSA